MRQYIDIVSEFIAESILTELETVSKPDNVSKEIGSGGKAVAADMNDMLPHRGVRERNQPQAYAEIFAKTTGKTFKSGFERETSPTTKKLRSRRNNDAGVKKLTKVSSKSDAILHRDFAGKHDKSRPIVPIHK